MCGRKHATFLLKKKTHEVFMTETQSTVKMGGVVSCLAVLCCQAPEAPDGSGGGATRREDGVEAIMEDDK